jgi:hypothetical protein
VSTVGTDRNRPITGNAYMTGQSGERTAGERTAGAPGGAAVLMGTTLERNIDLEAVAAHLSGVGPYTYDDARYDMGNLIARVKRLEEQRVVVAHLIKLAILHGVSPAAEDRLNDALIELGQEG